MLHPTSTGSLCAPKAANDGAGTGAAGPAAVPDRLVATSASMQKIRRTLEKVAPTRATVLLLGESGTGKELLARELHALSRRPARTLVAINCAAIPESLLESELFGYERGAFTGALKQMRGKIEGAAGGTLFLDEIGDMPLPLQCKLLRFLQERVIERVGGRQPIAVDVRIIAATNRNLQTAIAQRTFRDDLYYRLSEVTIAIPPLRDRESDALLIASDILRRSRRGGRVVRFAPDAIAAIESHTWPGNVRELENRVKRALIFAEGSLVTAADLGLAADKADWSEIPTLRETRRRAENQAVQRALALTGGNLSQAAKLLDVTRQILYNIVSRMGGPDDGE